MNRVTKQNHAIFQIKQMAEIHSKCEVKFIIITDLKSNLSYL